MAREEAARAAIEGGGEGGDGGRGHGANPGGKAMAMTVVITPTAENTSLQSRSTMVSQCLTREGKGVASSRGQTRRRQV